jgi:hypothetical protein
MRPSTFAFVLATACLAVSTSARADVTSDQCIDANARAQVLRRSGKLIASREQLNTCVDRACPGMVRDDCAKRLDELNRLQPTVVLGAQDAAGGDVVGVAVMVDGHLLASKLDGLPLDVDPGAHVFEFQTAGRPTVTRTLVLKEGEKGRIERVVFPAPPSSEPAAQPLAPKKEDDHSGLGAGKISGIVLAAVGLGGLAVGTAYGLFAKSAFDKSAAECRPDDCPDSSRPQALSNHHVGVTDATISTIGFVAGGVLFAGGLTLAIAAPPSRSGERHDTAAFRIAPALGPGTAGLDIRGEF